MPRLRDDPSAPDPEVMAFVDGALPPGDMDRIAARLAGDPDLRARVATWQRHRDLIAQAGRAADALPVNLRIVALERELARRLGARRRRAMLTGPWLRQVAAGVALFAAGWASHALLPSSQRFLAPAYPGYVEAALSAHHAQLGPIPVATRFDGHEIEAALAWMSEQMQLQLDSPRLDRLGYQVISARLDSGGPVPVAHFVYRDAQGETVTVSVAPHPQGTPSHALRVARAGGQSLAYWSEGPFDYSVVATADPGRLITLAAAVRD